jgi:hypothetical protein
MKRLELTTESFADAAPNAEKDVNQPNHSTNRKRLDQPKKAR